MRAFPEHLQGLLDPRAYPHAVSTVQLIETHISWVLLTGEFAYKIKRPVRYDFVDQRSLERREYLCHEELRLNRRFAPELYLRVSAISQADGQARIGGTGTVIEHAVVMRQFPRDQALDQLLQHGCITATELEAFGHELARLHAQLPAAVAGQAWGHPSSVRILILENAAACARAGASIDRDGCAQTLQATLATLLDAQLSCLEKRFAAGRVRECHGDLHAGNLVRYASRLLAFDCLEFDAALRWMDVADEVAFLIADLEARHQAPHAHAFLAGYLAESGDYEGCALLRLFRAHCALVRAKVIALSAAATEAPRFARYVEYARRSLEKPTPVLILMCGLSGSGKTWMAGRMAPQLRAVHLRSDLERRRITQDLRSGPAAPAQGRYTPAARVRVYRQLRRCTRHVLAGGYPAIVDATFARRADRAHFRRLALCLGVPICLVYCQAPKAVLRARVSERWARRDDPSEADLQVLEWQGAHFEPPLPSEALPVFEANTAEPEAVERLVAHLKAWCPAAAQNSG